MFADAIEASANDRNTSCSINVTYLQGADDILNSWREGKKGKDNQQITLIVLNIREYLENEDKRLGEDTLVQLLSEFSCPLNPDVGCF